MAGQLLLLLLLLLTQGGRPLPLSVPLQGFLLGGAP